MKKPAAAAVKAAPMKAAKPLTKRGQDNEDSFRSFRKGHSSRENQGSTGSGDRRGSGAALEKESFKIGTQQIVVPASDSFEVVCRGV